MGPNPIWLMSSWEEEEMWTQTIRVGKLCEDREKRANYKPERDQGRDKLLTPCSGTSSFQNCEEISFCCLSHPVCGTWLSPPEQMSILCFQPFHSELPWELLTPHSVPFRGSVGWIASHPLVGIWGWMPPTLCHLLLFPWLAFYLLKVCWAWKKFLCFPTPVCTLWSFILKILFYCHFSGFQGKKQLYMYFFKVFYYSYHYLIYSFKKTLAMPHSMWDLSSLIRDWTHVCCIGSA